MELTIYKVDAFSEQPFSGNPAAVVPLESWLPEEVMQNIALENNLSETAFFIPEKDGFHIRWFTPASEVKLCGHATLASAHVLFKHLNYNKSDIRFNSLSGILKVKTDSDILILDFPASSISEIKMPDNLKTAFNIQAQKCYKGRDDIMLIFEKEQDIYNLVPDFQKILASNTRGIITTAASTEFDFVSRFFAPAVGINEDPVTGSAHTMLIPYWSKRLNKFEMTARQVSKRGGILYCKSSGERVEIGGKAITFLGGKIFF
ncbi:PhzF family phenazine biosynthesis isomerase [Maribellus comscasis]|uniref:PhzF family phenazine biosynthesis isomerase n=1 Tax=Maribellus comscasis TaxID=2681766 RepID=A0A6I6K0V9_9BACT|nr:PhzF family phenazine biosynthesis protein [Maribellus comscasis]QGY47080.1 PhzF family phenazine biosynthesis isomerase [Maribellus comscasis]